MLAHPDAVVAALGVEPGMKVADFGSGAAMHLPGLSEAVGPSGRVYLVDVQKNLLERARQKAAAEGYRNADFVWADLEKPGATRLADGSIDRVLCSHVLFQIEQPAPVFAEAFRVLRPGGRLLVIEWAGVMASRAGKAVPQGEAESLARAAGFGESRPATAGGGQYAFTADKPGTRTAA